MDTSAENASAEKWSRNLCLMASVFALLRNVFDMLEIFTGQFSQSVCAWIKHIKVFFLCAAVLCTYAVLWLRQWQFYSTPALYHLSNKLTRTFSKVWIYVAVTACTITPIAHAASRTYTSSKTGCIMAARSDMFNLFEILYYIMAFMAQASLVALFNIPILNLGESFLERNTDQIEMIKRARWAALAALVSTITIALLCLQPGVAKYYLLGSVFYDFDILISLISVIISFTDWKERLAPCLNGREIEAVENGSEAVSANRTEIVF